MRLEIHGHHGIVVWAHAAVNLADGSRRQHLGEGDVIGVRLDIAATKHVVLVVGHGRWGRHLARV